MFLRAVEHPEKVCLIRLEGGVSLTCDAGSLREIKVEGPLGSDWIWTWTGSNLAGDVWHERVHCDAIIGVQEHIRWPKE